MNVFIELYVDKSVFALLFLFFLTQQPYYIFFAI